MIYFWATSSTFFGIIILLSILLFLLFITGLGCQDCFLQLMLLPFSPLSNTAQSLWQGDLLKQFKLMSFAELKQPWDLQ